MTLSLLITVTQQKTLHTTYMTLSLLIIVTQQKTLHTDGQTDGCQSVTLCFPVDAASIINHENYTHTNI